MNKIFLRWSVAVLVGTMFNSCTGDFEDLNKKPDALVAANINASMMGQMFAQSQYNAMYGQASPFQIAQSLFADLYCEYFATTQVNFDSDRHTQVGGWSESAWNSFYNTAAPQIKFVEDFTAANDMPVENALVKLWKVQAYHRITDYWGPIVYSNYGNEQNVVLYDSQEDIYRSFFVTLDEALSVLEQHRGESVFPSHDQVFDGDVDKWITFGNSLRLRLAMRVRYVDATLAKAQAEKAVAAGVMTTNDDNAMIATTINSRSPYWTITDWGEFRMSAAMESVLKGYDDPRVSAYFSPAVDGDDDADGFPYEGLRNGLKKTDIDGPTLNPQHSDMAPQFLNDGRGGSTAGAPIRIMSSSEVFFLRAEGALAGWTMGGTAQDLYNDGIEMSMAERTTATAGEITAYISSTSTPAAVLDKYSTPPTSDIPVAYETAGSTERQLEQIITQKWIALYPDGWEAWSELRRTGYPKLYPRLNSDNTDVPKDQIMRRLVFVTGEYTNNSGGVDQALTLSEMQAGDKNSTKLWWDAK
jgi:hypothetical protein